MSLEVNDILVNIRQFIVNGYNGFEKCLEEYQNNSEKMNIFISQCQYLIESGWDDAINDVDNGVDFFSAVLKPFLVNPAKNAFQHKENFSLEEEEIVKHFTKLSLFKLLFETHKNKSCIQNGHIWFARMKRKLDQEHLSLFSQTQLFRKKEYKGKMIDNIKELDGVIAQIPEPHGPQRQYYLAISSAFLGGILGSMNIISMKLSIVLIICAFVLGGNYLINKGITLLDYNRRELFFKPARTEYIKEALRSDQDIKKCFFVSDEEIKALCEVDDNVENNQKINLPLIENGMGMKK